MLGETVRQRRNRPPTNVEAGSFNAWQREQRGAASSAEGDETS
jgi:hypothetical protein